MTGTTGPDWLIKRGGVLQANPNEASWAVYFNGGPQYVLRVIPCDGKYACRIKQTINGKQLQNGGAHASPEEALQTGLEHLRQVLGW